MDNFRKHVNHQIVLIETPSYIAILEENGRDFPGYKWTKKFPKHKNVGNSNTFKKTILKIPKILQCTIPMLTIASFIQFRPNICENASSYKKVIQTR